jgi:hypothetical protein
VEVCPQSITLTDRIEGRPDRAASIAFLLHPAAVVRLEGRTAHLARGRAIVNMNSSLPISLEPASWWPDMGHELPTHRLRIAIVPGMDEVFTRLKVSQSPGA